MPHSYSELKDVISECLRRNGDVLGEINGKLKKFDPLPIGPPGADAFMPLNPAHIIPFSMGIIAGSEAPTLGEKLLAPFEHVSNLAISASCCTSDVMYCQVVREMIDELLIVNAACEVGGPVGAFGMGARSIKQSYNLINDVGIASADRAKIDLRPIIPGVPFYQKIDPGRANVPVELKLNPWEVRGRVKDAIGKTYFHPPSPGKGVLELQRARNGLGGNYNNNYNPAFRNVLNLNKFRGGAFILVKNFSKRYAIEQCIYHVPRLINCSAFTRVVAYATTGYTSFRLINFYVNLCKCTHRYSTDDEFRLCCNSSIDSMRLTITTLSNDSYEFLITKVYIFSSIFSGDIFD